MGRGQSLQPTVTSIPGGGSIEADALTRAATWEGPACGASIAGKRSALPEWRGAEQRAFLRGANREGCAGASQERLSMSQCHLWFLAFLRTKPMQSPKHSAECRTPGSQNRIPDNRYCIKNQKLFWHMQFVFLLCLVYS